MDQKNIKKIIEIDSRLNNFEFKSDSSRISQIIVNLISNSLKFTYKGYIKISVEIDGLE